MSVYKPIRIKNWKRKVTRGWKVRVHVHLPSFLIVIYFSGGDMIGEWVLVRLALVIGEGITLIRYDTIRYC